MKKELTLFEKEIIESILEHNRNNTHFYELSNQYKIAKVLTRTFTGTGFYTELVINDESLNIGREKQFMLGGINAEILHLKNGAGFILYVKDGFISTLEAYSYDEQWPDDAKIIKILEIGCQGEKNEKENF